MKALLVKESLNESFGQKDLVRMQDIKTKAGGNHDKEITLATTQANIIQDAGKAKARSEAAEEVFGTGSDIAQIFGDRAVALGGSRVQSVASPGALAPVTGPKIKGEKLKREFQKKYIMPSEKLRQTSTGVLVKPGGGFSRGLDPKAAMSTGIYADAPEIGGDHKWRDASILPLGKVQLGTGECQYFNVRTTWHDEGLVEIWQDRSGRKKKLIFTSGDKPSAKINDTQDFRHDQTGGLIGQHWKLIDYAPLKELQELIRLYGSSLSGYVYK
jgi:hypothetical protein